MNIDTLPTDAVEEHIAVAEVQHRSVKGLAALFFRTGLLQGIAMIATFLLTVFLDPAHYGIFAIVAATTDILVYFSDIGLAGALIQKKLVTPDDLATTFTIQQCLSLVLIAIGLLTTGIVSALYHLSPQGIWLFRAFLASFFLSTLKTIPSILLERKLQFEKLIVPQILENIVFYGVAVTAAWYGFGVMSFTYAVFLRSIVGLVAIYIISPWRPRLHFNWASFRSLASFGVPFQLNSLLGLVKDRLLVMYYGIVLPAAQVGYLQWAERWSLFPLRVVVDNVNKVTFPAYSRLQSEKAHLTKAIEKSLFFTSLFIFPVLVGMVVVSPIALQAIPKYLKWQPALLALALFAINGMWSSISTTLTNSFAAIGKISINLKLMGMWTVLTWVLTPLLLWRFGYNGVAAASALVATSSFIPMIIIKKLLPVKLVKNIFPQLASSVLMGLAMYWLSVRLPFTVYQLPIMIVLGVILYALFVLLFLRQRLIDEIKTVSRHFHTQ